MTDMTKPTPKTAQTRLRKDGTPVSPNWGGARANAGGARPNTGGPRPGSGRPRKVAKQPAARVSSDLVAKVSPYAVTLRHTPGQGNITTGGSLTDFSKAWVYVADCGNGITKIGMSSDLPQRMKQIRATLHFSVPVNPAHARTAETLVARLLGGQKSGTEYFCCKPERAAVAVQVAFAELRKVCRIDPKGIA